MEDNTNFLRHKIDNTVSASEKEPETNLAIPVKETSSSTDINNIEPVLTDDLKKTWVPKLETTTDNIVADIMATDDPENIKQLITDFNITQSKKNILRILKLNNLLDLVTEETLKRYKKCPDEVSNKELTDCMTVVSEQLEHSQKIVDSITEKPAIQVNQQKNEVNINVAPTLTKDQKENVIDIVTKILSSAQQNNLNSPPPTEKSQKMDVVDVDIKGEINNNGNAN
jgi:hypothetical protein